MKKTVGIKQFQAKLADSFPQRGDITIVTKNNIPTYQVMNIDAADYQASTSRICSACGQEIMEVSKK